MGTLIRNGDSNVNLEEKQCILSRDLTGALIRRVRFTLAKFIRYIHGLPRKNKFKDGLIVVQK
jgi:hypothetical protein